MSDTKFYDRFTQKKTSSKKESVNKQKKDYFQKKDYADKKSYGKNYKKDKNFTPKNKIISVKNMFSSGDDFCNSILNNFDEIIQGVRPLNSKQIQQLPDNIRELSHQLTDQRSERRLGYMNETVQLSSYVRYYTWWNLVRLTRLFSNLDSKVFPKENSICLDIGSGPLTVVTALWLSRPELRKKNLTWYCLDVSSSSLALGEDIYLSVAAKTPKEITPWKIIRVKGPFGTFIKQKADFITCANMLNETDQTSQMPPEYQTKKYWENFKTYSKDDTSFLLIEPGVPKAARTLSLLRERFLKDNFTISAPCPHADECPMNGFKAYTGSSNKWCNFAFATDNAPQKLLKLSEKAKLPKERATLSFMCAYKNTDKTENNENLLLRITSDRFSLPQNKSGFYACSSKGFVLISTQKDSNLLSGDLLNVQIKDSLSKTDQKTGALLIEL